MKESWRIRMRSLRAAAPVEQRAAAAARARRHLAEAGFMRQITRVMCFCSRGDEIDTLDLIRGLLAEGRAVCVPMIVGHGVMHAHRIGSLDDLAPGVLGILAPIRPDPVDCSPQVSLCPGLAFTERGDRIGHGGGYYDRYLAAHPDVIPVGLAYDFQIVDRLPVEPFDRPMRHIVTDHRVINCGRSITG